MLKVDVLEARDCPANLWTGEGWIPALRNPIPGWDGPVRSVLVDFQGEIRNAFVAGANGSARVVIRAETNVVFDRVFLDPTFRGGADIAAIDDKLYIAPLRGGGDHVQEYNLTTGAIRNFELGFGRFFRGGMTLSTADTDNDGTQELIALPVAGAPRLIAFDPTTNQQTTTFFAGPITDDRQYTFVPVGTDVQLDFVDGVPVEGLLIQTGFDPRNVIAVDWNGNDILT